MSQEVKRVTAVLFDLDDTLIDWSGQTADFRVIMRPHVENIYDHLAADNHTLPPFAAFADQYSAVIIDHWAEAKKTWSSVNFASALCDCFTRLNLDLERINYDAVMRAYDCCPYPEVVPFEDAHNVLDKLRLQGYKIGLLTNSMLPMWMRDAELRAYNLIDYFDIRISAGDTAYMKPHPAIFQHALSLLNISAEEAVFVGDRPANDIAGANAVGLTSVLMSPPHLNRKLNSVQPDHIITNLSELLPILEGLGNLGKFGI